MSNKVEAIYDMLNGLMERITREYDVQVHELVGILEHIKIELINQSDEDDVDGGF